MFDTQKFIDGVHDYIGKAIAPLADQVRSLVEKHVQMDQHVQNYATMSSANFEKINEAINSLQGRQPEKGDKGKDADPAPTLEEVLPPLLDATHGLVDQAVAEIKESGEAMAAGWEKKITDAIAGMEATEAKEDDELASTFIEALKQKFQKE